jgi:hypothetical protein
MPAVVAMKWLKENGAGHYGNTLVGGQLSFNGTAALAKHRLQRIIAADREAVPAYRWVLARPWVAAFLAIAAVFPAVVMPPLGKPRYRLERRR